MLGDHSIVYTDRANAHPGFVTVAQHPISRRGYDGAQERMRAVEKRVRMVGGLEHDDMDANNPSSISRRSGRMRHTSGLGHRTGPRDMPKHRYRRGRSLGLDQRREKR